MINTNDIITTVMERGWKELYDVRMPEEAAAEYEKNGIDKEQYYRTAKRVTESGYAKPVCELRAKKGMEALEYDGYQDLTILEDGKVVLVWDHPFFGFRCKKITLRTVLKSLYKNSKGEYDTLIERLNVDLKKAGWKRYGE